MSAAKCHKIQHILIGYGRCNKLSLDVFSIFCRWMPLNQTYLQWPWPQIKNVHWMHFYLRWLDATEYNLSSVARPMIKVFPGSISIFQSLMLLYPACLQWTVPLTSIILGCISMFCRWCHWIKSIPGGQGLWLPGSISIFCGEMLCYPPCPQLPGPLARTILEAICFCCGWVPLTKSLSSAVRAADQIYLWRYFYVPLLDAS